MTVCSIFFLRKLLVANFLTPLYNRVLEEVNHSKLYQGIKVL